MIAFGKKSLFVLGMVSGLSYMLSSCDRLYSNYLQETFYQTESRKPLTELEINLFTDSINAALPYLEQDRSMTYTRGDYSFYVKKYSSYGKPVLYVEHGDSGEYARTEKYYFIKDNTLTLLVDKTFTAANKVSDSSTTYFKNGVNAYSRHEATLNEAGMQKYFFKSDNIESDILAKLSYLEDAIQQKDAFDLVFEGIAEYPKTKYLIFSKNEVNAYSTHIKVEREDEFIHELCSNPMRYRGEKLYINWRVNDKNEAVYTNGALKKKY